MQNNDGFDNLAATLVEETTADDRRMQIEKGNMSHVNVRSSTKSSNYDYHRRKQMSTSTVKPIPALPSSQCTILCLNHDFDDVFQSPAHS